MKRGAVHSAGPADEGEKKSSEAPPQKRRRGRAWRVLLYVLVVLLLLGGIGRAILPWALRKYVNRTLESSPLYQGKIGTIRVHLWRGAYSIQDVQISKTTGNIPVPFFSSKR